MSHRSQPKSGSQLLYDRVEILPPSGDHAGASPFAIDVTPDPSGFMTAITALPFPSRPYRLDGNGNAVIAVMKDRKSTRLNSSHVRISYAGFCLKKKTRPSHGFS